MKRSTLLFTLLLFYAMAVFSQSAVIQGEVRYHDDWGIKNTKIYLIHLVSNSIVDSTTADSLGHYSFDSVPVGLYYAITETDLASGGVDIADVLKIIYHISPGIQLPLDKIQLLAADVDGNDVINFQDAHAILMYWAAQLGNGITFDFAVGDWVFTTNFTGDTIEVITASDTVDYTINGSSTGDVDGSFTPKKKPSASILVDYKDKITARAGETFDIPVAFNCQLVSGAAALVFEYPEEVLEIQNITTFQSNVYYDIADNKIFFIWLNYEGAPHEVGFGDLFFTITARMRPTAVPEQMLSLDIDPESNILDTEGKRIEHSLVTIPVIQVEKGQELLNGIYPNPARDIAAIHLNIPADGTLDLSITDMEGRVILNMPQREVIEGESILYQDISQLSPGTYLVRASFTGQNSMQQTIRLMVAGR